MKRADLWRTLGPCAMMGAVSGFAGCGSDGAPRGPTAEGAAPLTAGTFRVGFGKVAITPVLPDTWEDRNGNGKFDDDEDYVDGNGNGRFDAYYLAGFQQNRPARGVHDDIFAIAAVLDDGARRIGVVVIDSIGFMHDDVLRVRRRVPAEWGISHLVVVSTHNHEVPDLQGLWGSGPLSRGVNDDYLEQVTNRMVAAVGAATASLTPAVVRAFERPLAPDGLIVDTRAPYVFDPDVRVLQFLEAGTDRALGHIVTWANHPETLWSRNLDITADYPGYLREGIDRGLVYDGVVRKPGLGGITLFIPGAIGGLMTPLDSMPVEDRVLGQTFVEPSHEKARALGYRIADEVLTASRESAAAAESPTLGLYTKELELPVDNLTLFAATEIAKLIRRTVKYRWLKPHIRTEVGLITVGSTAILTVPGEVYPEIVNGGVERPVGGDYDMSPVEIPPWRALMPGGMKMVFGLANDSIGYIVPKSQWDTKAPYTYGEDDAPYGEGNSVGQETAPKLHQAVKDVCRQATGR